RCGRKLCSSITVHSPSFDCGEAKVRAPDCEQTWKQLPVSCESADGYPHDVRLALDADKIGAPGGDLRSANTIRTSGEGSGPSCRKPWRTSWSPATPRGPAIRSRL